MTDCYGQALRESVEVAWVCVGGGSHSPLQDSPSYGKKRKFGDERKGRNEGCPGDRVSTDLLDLVTYLVPNLLCGPAYLKKTKLSS